MLYALVGILVVNVLAVFIIARLGRRLSTTEECLIALEPELRIEGDRPRLGEPLRRQPLTRSGSS